MERGRRTSFKRATGTNQTHKAGKSVQEQEHMHVADRACSAITCSFVFIATHWPPPPPKTATVTAKGRVSFVSVCLVFSFLPVSRRSSPRFSFFRDFLHDQSFHCILVFGILFFIISIFCPPPSVRSSATNQLKACQHCKASQADVKLQMCSRCRTTW